MSILAWIEDQRKLKLLNAPKYNHPTSDGSQGLWTRCDHCGVILYIKHLKENQRVCFGCGYHLLMNSQERIEHLIDSETWRPLDETLSPCDPLEFRDQKAYTERLKEAQERTGLQDAVQTGTGILDGIPIALGVMDFNFMGGSMGSVVGEKITRLIEYATQEGLTLILVCASGGARMQEGILSLMQMAKISAALQVYQSCANLLYISVLTSPTTGGVTASFAMLGDLIFAEPKALIGFAGRRVIEQTLQEQLPEDFQTAEYLLHHGLLDLIVPRSFLKQALSETITLYKDAPFKRSGQVPHGIQQPLNFINEENIRRRWGDWCNSSLLSSNKMFEKTKSLNSSREINLSPNGKDSIYKTDTSYRQLLTSFQNMFDFLQNGALNTTVETMGLPLGEELKPSSKSACFSSFENSNLIIENFFNTSILLSIDKVIQWRTIETNQTISQKTTFLDNLLNKKNKNFFYSTMSKTNKLC
jgi:acetyl-CoA carboxylase carboxyl transferase subunit beta